MADDEAGRRAVLDGLPCSRRTSRRCCDGAIRYQDPVDPPLHEFMPDRFELVEQITAARLTEAPELGELRHSAQALAGAEGGRPDARHARCPAGTRHPGDLRDAGPGDLPGDSSHHKRTGRAPRVEIMIPLVAYVRDFELARDLEYCASASRRGTGREFGIGTMIEHACFVAGEIARHAEFFFGTTTSRRPPWASRATTSKRESSRNTSTWGSSSAPHSRRSIGWASASSCGSPSRARSRRAARAGGWHLRRARRRYRLDPLSSTRPYVSCSPFRVPIARGGGRPSSDRGPGSKR